MGKILRSAQNLELRHHGAPGPALGRACHPSKRVRAPFHHFFSKLFRVILDNFCWFIESRAQYDARDQPIVDHLFEPHHHPHFWSLPFGDQLCAENASNHCKGVIVVFYGRPSWHVPTVTTENIQATISYRDKVRGWNSLA